MRERRPKARILGDTDVGSGGGGDSEKDTGEKESGAGREPAE